MKKIIVATVLAAIGSTSTLAADLGARAPYTKAPAMVEQVYDWTGFYIGGDVGGANVAHNFTSNFSQNGLNPNNIQDNPFSRTSFIAGVHAGYNWQFAPHLVAGVEGDWQWVRSNHSFCRQTDILSVACVDSELNNSGFGTVSGSLSSVATVRARLGWSVDRVMFYGTGGAAFADVKSSLSLNCLSGGCGNDATRLATSVSSSTVQTGWVAGAGIEWMVGQNWILRAEYQHIDLGDVAAKLSPACGGCALSSSQNLRLDIGRAGISYKFGGPVLARY
jgi:outer membrane immunogenic protein